MAKQDQTSQPGIDAREPTAPARPTDVPTDSESAASPNRDRFPIVGIGASAGGLAAYEAFFSAIPPNAETGMAFVLVQHLSPDHRSILSQLIARQTSMPVYEASDGLEVRPNCIYVIPPNSDLTLLAGRLQVTEAGDVQRPRLPIDRFFRSLAEEQREAAIGVILSGSGSDGTQGIRAIKAEGGLVLAQDPETTEYASMPRSAILTGLVDLVLRPSEMPKQLTAIGTRVATSAFASDSVSTPSVREELSHICTLIRTRTGHDFSPYKESTIIRRIDRRMALYQIDSLADYRRHLQKNADETELLFRDLLIGVTSFFRDVEAFESLGQQALPRLFKGKPAGGYVRVWVCGCSTGEEAYSIAMLLHEQMQALPEPFKVQIFATDIDTRAIECARAGRYCANIATQVSPERLARHFIHDTETGEYLVCRGLRDMVLFSEQDVTRDPPFSRLDLISCRNMLIYVNGELQKRLIPLFHYALVPGGVLFLGPSETAGESPTLFAPMDRKWKIYVRKSDGVTSSPFVFGDFAAPLVTYRGHQRRSEVRSQGESGSCLRSITEQALLEYFAESAVLVNVHGQILYIRGKTGRFLEPAPGDATMSIVDMSRDGLKRELVTSLHHAVTTMTTVSRVGLRVKSNGTVTTTNVTVRPVSPQAFGAALPEPLFLVIFTAVANDDASPSVDSEVEAVDNALLTDTPGRVTQLEGELRAKEEYLQTTIEELETSNEELRSVNEELQSVNEELQSTNEELETSKEELQSVNEELATVNAELQNKVAELSRANNDMNNLLASTGVGTLFVDRQLRISRFTPAVTELINVIPSDVGRPLGHIVLNLKSYDQLSEEAQYVLDTLIAKQATVQSKSGVWYLMRMRPYRTVENVVDGVVITFVDISAAKQAEASLRRTAQFPDADPSPVLRASRDGALRYTNAAARAWLARRADGSAEALPADLRKIVQAAFEQNRAVVAEFSDVEGRHFEFTALRLPEEDYAHLYGIEVTERSRLDVAHGVALAIAEGIAASVQDPLLVLDSSLRVVLANQAFCSSYFMPLEQVEGQLLFECGQGAWDRPELRELLDRVKRTDSSSAKNVAPSVSIRLGQRSLAVQARRSFLPGQQDEIIVLSIDQAGARDPQ